MFPNRKFDNELQSEIKWDTTTKRQQCRIVIKRDEDGSFMAPITTFVDVA
jgi:hypothetical protein